MELGTYTDGRPLTYDPGSGAFRIGSAPVTLDQVLAYDRAGQLRWVNPETGAWARQLGGTPAPPFGQPEVREVTAVTQAAPPPFPSARTAAQTPPPATTAGYGPPPGTSSPGQAPLPSGGGRRGMSTGLIIGIIAVVAVVAVGGFLAYRSLSGKKDKPVAAASAQPVTAATTPAAVTGGSDTGSGVTDNGTTAGTATSGPLTKQAGRDVVNQFLTLRDEGDTAGSVALCAPELFDVKVWDELVNDPYWNPETWRLTFVERMGDDLAVTSSGWWPSGREATTFKVVRDPDTGQALIAGFLDPNDLNQLWIP